MAELRSVRVTRDELGSYTAFNEAGVELPFGSQGDTFTPVELLLAAIAGCTAMDVDYITSKRATPDSFEVTATAEKVKTEHGNYLQDVAVTFRLRFPEGEAGDKARAILSAAVQRSHDSLCTVSRTTERGTEIGIVID